VVARLLDDDSAPQIMKHLNITLYPISAAELRQILVKHKGLAVLNVSLVVEDSTNYKNPLVEAIVVGTNLEQVEIVLCPSDVHEHLDITVNQEEITNLTKSCTKLSSFKVNHLRRQRSSTAVECILVNNKWDIKKVEAGSTMLSERTRSGKTKPVSIRCDRRNRLLMHGRSKLGVHGLSYQVDQGYHSLSSTSEIRTPQD
jgi:hypothetical protein